MKLARQLEQLVAAALISMASGVVLAGPAVPATPTASTAPTQALDLDAALKVALQNATVPAMGALVIRSGAVVATAVSGKRAADQADAVQPDDVWHLGSNGKAMTAAMIARLVERGVLSWDAPLSTLLPELAAGMQPGYRSVTLRDLFAHQAGLNENIAEEYLPKFMADQRALPVQRVDYARIALAQTPGYAAGTADGYSNNGPLVAAVAAERATGMSYEQLMQREVFDPLQMRSARFGATHRGQPLGHLQGKPKEGRDADNPPALAPAGEIHMSLQDWAKFAIDQMQGELGQGKLLKPASYKMLHDAAREGGKFGLGWRRQPSMAGMTGPFLSHSGSNEFWFAVIALRPSTLDGALVVANAGPDVKANAAVADVVKQIVKTFPALP